MTRSRIVDVAGRTIFDSRGRPTVEVDVRLECGAQGRGIAPSGASTGKFEAFELRDGIADRFVGRSVDQAVGFVNNEIRNALIGREAEEQRELDALLRSLDGTENLRRLGGNAVVAASLAICRAAAAGCGTPLYVYVNSLLEQAISPTLPVPMVNIFSGGAHANRGMDFQDFLIIPTGASSLAEAIDFISRIREAADELLIKRGISTLLADEGGLSPGCATSRAALELLSEAVAGAGLEAGTQVSFALDVAATQLSAGTGDYHLKHENRFVTRDEMIEMLVELSNSFPIISIEDALDEEDWDGWVELTARLPRIQIVGDDFFTTNPLRIERGIHLKAANAVLIKVNQIGTLSDALTALEMSRRAGYRTVVSARSGETEDDFIADLAIGTGAGQIKIGSFRSSERLSKYNQLVRIAGNDGALQLADCFQPLLRS